MKIEMAIVSVKKGRKGLARRIKNGEQIPITLTGFLNDVWGEDDGKDQEFEMTVTRSTEVTAPNVTLDIDSEPSG